MLSMSSLQLHLEDSIEEELWLCLSRATSQLSSLLSSLLLSLLLEEVGLVQLCNLDEWCKCKLRAVNHNSNN